MKALVTIEVPDDGKCEECDFVAADLRGDFVCEILWARLRKDGRALKKCRDAVKMYKEGRNG